MMKTSLLYNTISCTTAKSPGTFYHINCVSKNTLGAMDVLMIRYLGEDQQGLGKSQGIEEEQQGRPQQEGDQVRLGYDSISGSRTSMH
jgi:hypothetical protein